MGATFPSLSYCIVLEKESFSSPTLYFKFSISLRRGQEPTQWVTTSESLIRQKHLSNHTQAWKTWQDKHLGIFCFCDAASSTTKKKALKIDGHLVAFSCPIAFAQDVQDDFFQSGERPENWGWIF